MEYSVVRFYKWKITTSYVCKSWETFSWPHLGKTRDCILAVCVPCLSWNRDSCWYTSHCMRQSENWFSPVETEVSAQIQRSQAASRPHGMESCKMKALSLCFPKMVPWIQMSLSMGCRLVQRKPVPQCCSWISGLCLRIKMPRLYSQHNTVEIDFSHCRLEPVFLCCSEQNVFHLPRSNGPLHHTSH